MEQSHPLYRNFERARHHVHAGSVLAAYRELIWAELRQIEEWITLHPPLPAHKRIISFGLPVVINSEGNLMAYQLASNLIALFPIKVAGEKPAADDVFTVVSNNPDQFTADIDVMPDDAAADAGFPAVKVTCLTHDGAANVSFTVSDSKGDTAGTETFDITAPAAPPPPPGQISIDEAGVATMANPSPPA